MQVAGTSTKSGDNDALKALLDDERQHGRHVGIAPQCAFNSYVWRSRIRDWWRLVYMPNTILLGLHRPGPQLHPKSTVCIGTFHRSRNTSKRIRRSV